MRLRRTGRRSIAFCARLVQLIVVFKLCRALQHQQPRQKLGRLNERHALSFAALHDGRGTEMR